MHIWHPHFSSNGATVSPIGDTERGLNWWTMQHNMRLATLRVRIGSDRAAVTSAVNRDPTSLTTHRPRSSRAPWQSSLSVAMGLGQGPTPRWGVTPVVQQGGHRVPCAADVGAWCVVRGAVCVPSSGRTGASPVRLPPQGAGRGGDPGPDSPAQCKTVQGQSRGSGSGSGPSSDAKP